MRHYSRRKPDGTFYKWSGEKTPRMLEVEAKIGRTLQEDFKSFHTKDGWKESWSLTKLAKRWGVPRGLLQGGGRSEWLKALDLKVNVLEDVLMPTSEEKPKKTCAACDESETRLETAHWYPKAWGGDDGVSNTIPLCPSCHDKLDRKNPNVTMKARNALLIRGLKKIFSKSKLDEERLVAFCAAVMFRDSGHDWIRPINPNEKKYEGMEGMEIVKDS